MLTRQQYEEFRADIETDFESATRSAREKRDAAFAALNDFWKAHGTPNVLPNPGVDDKSPDAPAIAVTSDSLEIGSTLAHAVREGVKQLNDPFTRQQVMDWLIARRPELTPKDRAISVATAISRMVGKEIEVDTQGAGRRPAKYKKRSA